MMGVRYGGEISLDSSHLMGGLPWQYCHLVQRQANGLDGVCILSVNMGLSGEGHGASGACDGGQPQRLVCT